MNRSQLEQVTTGLNIRSGRLAILFALTGSILVLSGSQLQGATIYVRSSAAGANNGTSWANAYTDLQAALADADPGDQVWVAMGRYRPAGSGGSNTATFQLKNGVAMYGGFAGTETLLAQRNPSMNETSLSGDLNGNDVPSNPTSNCCVEHGAPGCDDAACEAEVCSSSSYCCTNPWSSVCAGAAGFLCEICDTSGNKADNVLHVVTGSGTDSSAIIDGFIVTGGFSRNGPEETIRGAGMVNITGSPTVRNCQFVGNAAGDRGSGMLNSDGSHPLVEHCNFIANGGGPLFLAGIGMMNQYGSHPTISDCTFSGNFSLGADIYGGGLTNLNASPTIINCRFVNNTGNLGGAMLNDSESNPLVVGCIFSGNEAGGFGGALVNNNGSLPVFVNSVFSGNTAGAYGGACVDLGNNFAKSTFINCTFSGNSAPSGSSIYYQDDSYERGDGTIARNCIFSDEGTDTITAAFLEYSCVRGVLPPCCGGGNNLQVANVMFKDADGADGVYGTPDDDLRLLTDSPCIDAGNNNLVASDSVDIDNDSNVDEPIPSDLTGGPRFFDDPGTFDTGAGPAPIVDMGALEFYPDCNNNSVPDSIDIAQGVLRDLDSDGVADACDPFVDCNQNGVHDPIEIANGSAVDIDEDGIIDTCDSLVDCNHNGIADATDIADGTLHDQNGDGIADTCDPSLVPTMSQWGLIILSLSLLCVARIQFGRELIGNEREPVR